MRILSLDGGGYLGLTSASFLEAAEAHFGTTCHEQFDFFTGTSTGAIIALALAMGMKGKQVAELYQELGRDVFPSPPPKSLWARVLGKAKNVTGAKHDNQPLKQCLSRVFGDTTVGDIASKGKYLLIPAYSITSGRPRLFKTDHSKALSRDSGHYLKDIALASAAAPTYLPVVALNNPKDGSTNLLCDGGVCANNPTLLAYTEAVYELMIDPSKLRILSVSTPRPDLGTRAWVLGQAQAVHKDWGYVAWLRDGKLADIFTNAASMLAHETVRRLVRLAPGAAYERVEFENRDGIPMDVATPEATETLRHLGSDHAAQNKVREQIQSFFQHAGN